MSGHSKWSTIKRQKGAADAKRGQLFTKLSNAISLAAKAGGADPAMNPRLRLAIDTAKASNMPKENIDRAVKRAQSKLDGELEETVYEGFGPGGFSIIIEAITDNKQRTTPEVKSRIEKLGGSLGNPGSVSYQFEQRGLITIDRGDKNIDEIFSIAVDSGAEDIEEVAGDILLYTRREDLAKVRDTIAGNSLIVKNAEFIRIPLSTIYIQDKDSALKALQFIEKIEELDDIQRVYANFDIPEEIGQALA